MEQLLFPILSVLGLIAMAIGAVALAKSVFGPEAFEPVKRDIHWRVTECTECGGRIENPVNTMTRDEYYCGECAAA